MDIQLLDCTLRDGGYINDWEFGHDNLVSVFERVVSANVDIIEVGFLDERRVFDRNRSIMPDTASVEKIYGNLDRNKTMVVGMIDYGTCSLKQIQPCSESFLDGIRVIFKKHIRKEAVEFCGELVKLGYKVFVQAVSITSYTDKELLDLIELTNGIEPYALSMVDTYGLLHQDTLMHYAELIDHNLKPEIGMGYHSHNNFQLGYANCIEMLAKKTRRRMVVDATIYGMGKSAGNTPIELLAMHLNEHYDKHYDISQILEAVDANIMDIYKVSPWGYNMFYYIAASNDCHPNYVSYLMNKRTLSVKSINEILDKLDGEKKLLYDETYIEQLYIEYQTIEVDDQKDIEELTSAMAGRNILLVGPGNKIMAQKERVEAYVREHDPIVISVNFISNVVRPNYIFLSNAKRYVQLATALSDQKDEFQVIATSNVTKTNGKFDYTLKYSSLLDLEAKIVDNSFIMLLKVMIRLGVRQVALCGFDGYVGEDVNYVNSNMEYHFDREQAEELNHYVSKVLNAMEKDLQFTFITDSLYEK